MLTYIITLTYALFSQLNQLSSYYAVPLAYIARGFLLVIGYIQLICQHYWMSQNSPKVVSQDLKDSHFWPHYGGHYATYMYIIKDISLLCSIIMCHMDNGENFDRRPNISCLLSKGLYYYQEYVHASVFEL